MICLTVYENNNVPQGYVLGLESDTRYKVKDTR